MATITQSQTKVQPRPDISHYAREYDKNGYVVIRSLLVPAEAHYYKRKLQEFSGLSDADFPKGWRKPGGINQYPDLWPLIVNEKLLTIARAILGDEICYLQHSDLHVFNNRVQWHRDSAHRTFGVGPDWDESREKYQVMRAAIYLHYLQPYQTSHSALGVIPGSHRSEPRFMKYEMAIKKKLASLRGKKDVSPDMITTKVDWVKTEPGDAVLFDARLYHTPSYIIGPKYSIFLAYGPDNTHSHNHREYYTQTRTDLEYQTMSADLKAVLRANDLLCE